MPTPTRTPGSNLDPHQKDYNDKFDAPTTAAPDYPDVEKGLRDLENFNRDTAADVDKTIAEREQEPETGWRNNTSENPGRKGTSLKDRAKVVLSKKGGMFGLVGGLGIGAVFIASFLAPSSLLVNLMENLTNTNDSSSTAMERRFMKAFGFVSGNDGICANTSKTIRCSMGRISNKALAQLSKKNIIAVFDEGVTNTDSKRGYPSKNPKGYNFDLPDGSIRYVPQAELVGFFSENPRYAARVLGTGGAFNVRVKAWSGKYITQKLYRIAGITRNGGLADGDTSNNSGSRTQRALTKLRASIPGLANLDGVLDSVKTKASTQLGKAQKGGAGYMIAVASCVGVKAPGYIAAGVAAVQLAQIISIAHDAILSPGSKLKASGVDGELAITADEVGDIGSMLTEETARESDGAMTSALDSAILLAALGVNKNKAPIATSVTPGYSILKSDLVKSSEAVEETTEPACNAIMSPSAMWTAFAVDSAVTVAASTTAVGGLAKIVAGWAVGQIVASVATELVAGVAQDAIIDLAKNDAVETAQGEQLGDVIGVSALSFFSAGGMARNLPVLKESQLADYAAVKQESEAFQREMEIASLNPFDASSQYTFLGSIVHNTKLAFALQGGSTIISPLSVFSTIGGVVNSLLPNASAATQQTQNSCGYAAEFGLETSDPLNTPAINAAGLPCTGITSEQAAMSTETALSLIQGEGWLDESKSISDSSTIEDLLQSGYIKADTPLSDFITSCSDALSGDYLINAAGCTVSSSAGSIAALNEKLYNACLESSDTSSGGCIKDEYDGGEGDISVNNPQSLVAMSVFLLDYQLIKSINGEDENEPNTTSAVGSYDQPDQSEEKINGWTLTSNTDYSSTPCDPRTKDMGIVTTGSGNSTIRLCLVEDAEKYPGNLGTSEIERSVNSIISTRVVDMFEDAYEAGVPLGISSAFRADNQSEHGKGLALDVKSAKSGFSLCYIEGGSKTVWDNCNNGVVENPDETAAFAWLQQNGKQYGFYNLAGHYNPAFWEPWHWSMSGG